MMLFSKGFLLAAKGTINSASAISSQLTVRQSSNCFSSGNIVSAVGRGSWKRSSCSTYSSSSTVSISSQMVGHTCSYSSPAQCCISNSNCISTSMNTRVTDRAMANSRRAFSTVGNGISQGKRGSGKKLSKEEEELLALPVEEIARRIDTTLTPQQKEYVEALKKKYKGGNPNKRSLYRDVPRPEEIPNTGSFVPNMAENAEELIDYALSHIPPRAGHRGTRAKRRMEIRHEIKRENDRRRKVETHAALMKKHARLKRIRQEVKEMYAEAARIRGLKQQSEGNESQSQK